MKVDRGTRLLLLALVLFLVGCKGTVSGRVEEEGSGTLIEGATLLFVLQGQAQAPQLAAHSDASGTFELSLEEGLYELISVAHPQYVWVQHDDPQMVVVEAFEDNFFIITMR